jgi:hypothetical protein
MPDHPIPGHPLPFPGGIMYLIFIALVFLSCGMGRHSTAGGQPLSLEALHAACGLPAPCDAGAPWEGRVVAIAAQVDPRNIFDQRQYPQLPYEKFKLVDGQGRAVEVWPQAGDNRPIFDKLAARPSDRIVVRGRLAVVKMPIMGKCLQGVKVLIDAADQIEYQSN